MQKVDLHTWNPIKVKVKQYRFTSLRILELEFDVL